MMYGVQPKKLLILNILDILRRESDKDHRLSQRDIADRIAAQYGMEPDRKAVKRNLMDLIDFGYDIEYTETVRRTPNPKTGELEENRILSDFYLVRDFDDSELRLLIDSVLFSRNIPSAQREALIAKLEKLSSQYFRARTGHIRSMPDTAAPSQQLFLTIEVLDEAISRRRQAAFHYTEYGLDKRPRLRLDGEGNPRRYVVNPYQIVAASGRHYLLCNYDKYDDLAHYRLDRIVDIELLDTPAKPMGRVKGLEHGLDVPRHMLEHIYPFSGETAPVTFRAKRYLLSEIIDWFGDGIQISDVTEDEFTVRVTVDLEAMRRWAVQYAVHAWVLGPEQLVEAVKGDIEKAAGNYR